MNDNSFEAKPLETNNLESDQPVSNDDNPVVKNDSSLEALVNQEQSVAKQKLLAELGREPSQEEIDEWLQAHTESY